MNWKALLPLVILGPIMGMLVVMGQFPPGVDRFAWIGVVLTSAFFVARRAPESPVLNGFAIGFWTGATAMLLQALFLKRMLINNPSVVEHYAHAPRGFDMQFFVYMLVPFNGVAIGGITALVAMFIRRAMRQPQSGSKGGQTHP